jgi:hypothetical protein
MKVKFLMFALVVAFGTTINARDVTEKSEKCEIAAGPKAAVREAGPKAAGSKAQVEAEAKEAEKTAKRIEKQNEKAEKMRKKAAKK